MSEDTGKTGAPGRRARDDQPDSLLNEIRNITVSMVPTLAQQAIDRLCAELFSLSEQAANDQLQSYYWSKRRSLLEQRAQIIDALRRELSTSFEDFPPPVQQTQSEDSGELDLMSASLVGDRQLEESFAVSELAARIANRFPLALEGLEQRLAVLARCPRLEESQLPMGPTRICQAYRDALADVALEGHAFKLAFRHLEQRLVPQIGALYDRMNQRLVEAGILPNLRFGGLQPRPPQSRDPAREATDAESSQLGEGSTAASPETDADAARASATDTQAPARGTAAPANRAAPQGGINHETLQALPGLAAYLAESAQDPVSDGLTDAERVAALRELLSEARGQSQAQQRAPTGAYRETDLVAALGDIQQRLDPPEASAPPLRPDSERIKEEVARYVVPDNDTSALEPSHADVIEIVGMVFQYMLDDTSLPDSVKALLSYLHTPLLKVALIDPSILSDPQHSARRLLDNLAELGAGWVNEGERDSEAYRTIKSTVHRVLSDFQDDLSLFDELVTSVEAYIKRLKRRAEHAERRAREAAEGAEKLELARQRATAVISANRPSGLTANADMLLSQPWTDVLALIHLREGEDSEAWRRAVSVAEAVATGFDTDVEAERRRAARQTLQQELGYIHSSLKLVGYSNEDAKALLADLTRSGPPRTRPAATAGERWARAHAGKRSEAAEQERLTELSAEEQRILGELKKTPFGSRFQLAGDGGKRTLKLTWYSPVTLHCVLVDQGGNKVSDLSLIDLAQYLARGTGKLLPQARTPFVERAIMSVLQGFDRFRGSTSN